MFQTARKFFVNGSWYVGHTEQHQQSFTDKFLVFDLDRTFDSPFEVPCEAQDSLYDYNIWTFSALINLCEDSKKEVF